LASGGAAEVTLGSNAPKMLPVTTRLPEGSYAPPPSPPGPKFLLQRGLSNGALASLVPAVPPVVLDPDDVSTTLPLEAVELAFSTPHEQVSAHVIAVIAMRGDAGRDLMGVTRSILLAPAVARRTRVRRASRWPSEANKPGGGPHRVSFGSHTTASAWPSRSSSSAKW